MSNMFSTSMEPPEPVSPLRLTRQRRYSSVSSPDGTTTRWEPLPSGSMATLDRNSPLSMTSDPKTGTSTICCDVSTGTPTVLRSREDTLSGFPRSSSSPLQSPSKMHGVTDWPEKKDLLPSFNAASTDATICLEDVSTYPMTMNRSASDSKKSLKRPLDTSSDSKASHMEMTDYLDWIPPEALVQFTAPCPCMEACPFKEPGQQEVGNMMAHLEAQEEKGYLPPPDTDSDALLLPGVLVPIAPKKKKNRSRATASTSPLSSTTM
nr:MAG: hypothetical protein [Chemarfal virus 47]